MFRPYLYDDDDDDDDDSLGPKHVAKIKKIPGLVVSKDFIYPKIGRFH